MIFVRSLANANSNTMSLPPYQLGDMVFMAAVGTVAPVVPNGLGWQLIASIGSSGFFLTLARRPLFYINESCGIFTNAFLLSALVYGSDSGFGVMGENWGTHTQSAAVYRLMNFAPVNRTVQDFNSFQPMTRINVVAVNSTSPFLSGNLPAGWTMKTDFSVALPIPVRLNFLDSYYSGGTIGFSDVSHGAGIVPNRSIGTACFETSFPISGSRGRLPFYFTGSGVGAF